MPSSNATGHISGIEASSLNGSPGSQSACNAKRSTTRTLSGIINLEDRRTQNDRAFRISREHADGRPAE